MLNIKRQYDQVTVGAVCSDTQSAMYGSTYALIFVGANTLATDTCGMKSDKQFFNTLEENTSKRGSTGKFISDSAQSEVSNRVEDVLCALFIDDWKSEPCFQHQNFAERRYQTTKRQARTLLDVTSSPACAWLLCITRVCFVLNTTCNETINKLHMSAAAGSTCSSSPLLRFNF